MARTKTIECEAGSTTVTTFVGPARLADRRCVQIGDDVVLDRDGIEQLHMLLGHWMTFGSLPPLSDDTGNTP